MEAKDSATNRSGVTRRQVHDLVETLPAERLQSVYDYVLFLKTRPFPSQEELRYREIEEAVSELEQLREASAAEYHVGIAEGQPTVVRNQFGLSIGGTRLTLYHIMDYVTAGWSPSHIQRWFNFTDQQIADIMDYIENHREEVEAEYQQVLDEAERERAYWTERNKDLLAQTEERIRTAQGPVWDKLRAQRAKLKSE